MIEITRTSVTRPIKEHDWEAINITVMGGLWQCTVCGARTNNAFLMTVFRECPGPPASAGRKEDTHEA